MRKRDTDIINRSVNNWFHKVRPDGSSPENTIRQFSNIFLGAVNRMNFQLTCTPTLFRINLCEALCMMFVATKKKSGWYGPSSEAPRPEGWTEALEMEWKDMLRSMYFSYSFFENMWGQIGEGEWEKILPYWRVNIESIAFHYIVVRTEFFDCHDIIQKSENDYSSGPVHSSLPDYEDNFY